MRSRARASEDRDLLVRKVVLRQQPVAHGVVDVVIDVGHAVDEPHDLPLERLWLALAGVREDAVTDLVREVQRARDPQRLLVVAETTVEPLLHGRVERILACVPEGGVPHVVPEADRLYEILVEPQRPRDDARDRRRLERVGHPRAVVIALGIDEHLRLSLQPPERLRVDDAVAVALKVGANLARLLGEARGRACRASAGQTGRGTPPAHESSPEAHGGQRRGTTCGIAAPTKSAANANPSVP